MIFRRLFAEETPNGFAKGKFCSGAARFPVGEALAAEFIDLRTQFP
jgi:hypothetical protein